MSFRDHHKLIKTHLLITMDARLQIQLTAQVKRLCTCHLRNAIKSQATIKRNYR